MSIAIMTYVWQEAPFKGSELMILLALADSASDEGYCWPSQETLARKARLSVNHLRVGLRKLEAAGWVEREQGEGGGKGQYKTNRYRVRGVNGIRSVSQSDPPDEIRSLQGERNSLSGVNEFHSPNHKERTVSESSGKSSSVEEQHPPARRSGPISKESQLHLSPQAERRAKKKESEERRAAGKQPAPYDRRPSAPQESKVAKKARMIDELEL